LHEAAVRAIKAARPNGGKLPSFTAMKAEYAKLTTKKNALNDDYAKLKRQARELGVIKSNVDSILRSPVNRTATRGRAESL